MLETGEIKGKREVVNELSIGIFPSGSPPAAATREYENELCLYSFDRETGKVELKAVGNPQMDGLFATPFLAWFRGKISVLNQASFYDALRNLSYFREYFTRF